MPTLGLIGVGAAADDGTGDPFRTGGQIINANTVILQDFIDAKGFTEISQESDFAVQTASTITLESKTVYFITDAFTTAKNFTVEDGAVWTSFNQNGPLITYSGSGTMFSGTDASFAFQGCIINCPSATAFDFTDTIGSTVFKFQDATILACNKIGTFTGLANALFVTGAALNTNDGVTYTGTNLTAATVDKMFMISSSAGFIAIDLGVATIQNIEVTNLIVQAPSGAIGISGAAASANVLSGFLGMVANCSFSGGMTAPLSGITVDDFRWTFSDNSPIPDTVHDALLAFNGNATETVIGTQNVAVIVNATWTCVRSSIFECTTGGRVTSESERDLTGAAIDISVGLLSSGGGTIDVTVYLAKNGTEDSGSGVSINISGSNQAFISLPWLDTTEDGDFYEVFVENNTNTTNIIVESAKFRFRT